MDYSNKYNVRHNDVIVICINKDKTITNVLQTADRDLSEMAYDVNHATALLLPYIEIVATASQLVDTLLYLKYKYFFSFISIKN